MTDYLEHIPSDLKVGRPTRSVRSKIHNLSFKRYVMLLLYENEFRTVKWDDEDLINILEEQFQQEGKTYTYTQRLRSTGTAKGRLTMNMFRNEFNKERDQRVVLRIGEVFFMQYLNNAPIVDNKRASFEQLKGICEAYGIEDPRFFPDVAKKVEHLPALPVLPACLQKGRKAAVPGGKKS